MKLNKNKPKEIICKICKSKVIRTSNRQKYCFKCSKKIKYKYKVPREDKIKNCIICDKEYFARQRNQKCCSDICRDFYYKDKYKKHYLNKSQLERIKSMFSPMNK